MAWSNGGTSVRVDKSAGSSFNLAGSGQAITAGTIQLAWIVSDNTGSTLPELSGPAVTSIPVPTGETNQWVQLASIPSTSATAGASVRGHLYGLDSTVSFGSFNPIVTLDASVAAKIGALTRNVVGGRLADATYSTHPGSGSLSPANISWSPGDSVLFFMAGEDNTALNRLGITWATTTPTPSSGSTNVMIDSFTTGGGAAANVAMSVVAYWDVTNSAANVSASWNAGVDGAFAVVVLKPAASGLTGVTKTLQTSWHTRSSVTKNLVTSWNTSEAVTPVTKALSTTWNVRSSATQTLNTTWRVLGSVTKPLSTTWVVRTGVTKPLSTTWVVRAPVTKALSTTWIVKTAVNKDLSTSWNVAGATLAPVTKTLSTSWNTRSGVTKALGTTWVVRSGVVDTFSTTWIVRSGVTKSLATTWNVLAGLASVTKTLSTSWRVVGVVIKPFSTTWIVRSSVTKTLSTTWTVKTSVNKALSTTWGVRGGITKATSTRWNVRSGATKSLNTRWGVRAGTERSLSTSWKVLSNVSGPRYVQIYINGQWIQGQMVVGNGTTFVNPVKLQLANGSTFVDI